MKFRGYLLNNFWIVASKASLKTIAQVEDKWWYVRWSISALKPNQKLDKKQLSGNTTLDRTDCQVSSDNTSTKCGVCSRNLWIRCENFGCKQKNHFEVSQLREERPSMEVWRSFYDLKNKQCSINILFRLIFGLSNDEEESGLPIIWSTILVGFDWLVNWWAESIKIWFDLPHEIHIWCSEHLSTDQLGSWSYVWKMVFTSKAKFQMPPSTDVLRLIMRKFSTQIPSLAAVVYFYYPQTNKTISHAINVTRFLYTINSVRFNCFHLISLKTEHKLEVLHLTVRTSWVCLKAHRLSGKICVDTIMSSTKIWRNWDILQCQQILTTQKSI